MKILDRYVLRSFLINYLISFVVLIGMYVVLDMVFNFDELVKRTGEEQLSVIQIAGQIAEFYFFQSFLIFVQLSGVIPVAAAAFTLIRMSRFNELTAILAAGVPLLRVAAPIIIAGVILQALLAVDQELIIPRLIPKLTAKHDEIHQENPQARVNPIQAMQDERGGLLFAGDYAPLLDGTAMIRVFDVTEFEDGRPVAHITAQRTEWDPEDQEWILTAGRRVTGLLPHETRSEHDIRIYKSNITPDEIALFRSGENVNLLSTARIDQLLQRPKSYGVVDLLRVKHFRISQLIMNFVMLLVAIPCVLTRDPGKLKGSIFKCIVLVGLCMASYFLAYQIAGKPRGGPEWVDRWAAIMAFAPVLVFGIVAIYLLDKLGTRDT